MWRASDETLVAGLAAGDADAALVFVRRFQSRAYGLALTITRDSTAAEEVAQDAFVRAWRYAASFDARRGTPAAWLLGIVRNAAIDRLTAAGRHAALSVLDVAEVLRDVVGDGDVASRHADLAVVVEGLRALPPEQRDTIVAAAYLGFTAREMSEAWDVPIGTVKSRLRLAVHKLREALAGVDTTGVDAAEATS
jgi:RNA polymerase sigma-70 factor (ECF subfamily)